MARPLLRSTISADCPNRAGGSYKRQRTRIHGARTQRGNNRWRKPATDADCWKNTAYVAKRQNLAACPHISRDTIAGFLAVIDHTKRLSTHSPRNTMIHLHASHETSPLLVIAYKAQISQIGRQAVGSIEIVFQQFLIQKQSNKR